MALPPQHGVSKLVPASTSITIGKPKESEFVRQIVGTSIIFLFFFKPTARGPVSRGRRHSIIIS
jgi:hypothetical protein